MAVAFLKANFAKEWRQSKNLSIFEYYKTNIERSMLRCVWKLRGYGEHIILPIFSNVSTVGVTADLAEFVWIKVSRIHCTAEILKSNKLWAKTCNS